LNIKTKTEKVKNSTCN